MNPGCIIVERVIEADVLRLSILLSYCGDVFPRACLSRVLLHAVHVSEAGT